MTHPNDSTPEDRARSRVKSFSDVMWHAATFLIVNGFLWSLDIVQGDGVNWAFWVTITWGIGLAFHIASYFLDENGLQNRRYQRFLDEERARDAGSPTGA
ncbi:MAG TPA: 2TM domain-containing protein [Acidimicrobiia bacterium]|nr:2TM domain-containing protein [Acidimicrobiia bacterium]